MANDPHSSNRFDGPIVIDDVSTDGYIRLGLNIGPQIIPYQDGAPFPVFGDIGSLLVYFDRSGGGDADLYQTTDGLTWDRFITAREIRSQFFPANYTTNVGTYAVQEVGAAATARFTFNVPTDFEDLVSCLLVYISSPAAAGNWKDIETTSNYATHGQAYNTHTGYQNPVYTLTADVIEAIALHEILTDLEADDRVGIEVTHNAIGGSLFYLGVELLYTP